MAKNKKKPVVVVPSCQRMLGEHGFHVVGQKYVDALRLVGLDVLLWPCQPVGQLDLSAVLALADGVLLTGSPSNIDPSHYQQTLVPGTSAPDVVRDATTLSLLPQLLEQGIPVFAICRGLQEFNVALGGSLHQEVHKQSAHHDHRDVPDQPLSQRYGPAHTVRVLPKSKLAAVLAGAEQIQVNSLHGQGIDRLAPGAVAEAYADDGLIEAISHSQALGFNLAVQWHPEWQAAHNPDSMRLFGAFAAACWAYAGLVPET